MMIKKANEKNILKSINSLRKKSDKRKMERACKEYWRNVSRKK